ncbi:hypothetical protein CLV58_12423 [Spirosoma oryzae]|uniref:Uncharacterized protein n=1 Tax=Spirosoma oryzae TaxID=1469603 RepID=A0A2T0SAG6_9BACT|nr:hypothetical protein CLV58_12423 [Spirosoma oryzae]
MQLIIHKNKTADQGIDIKVVNTRNDGVNKMAKPAEAARPPNYRMVVRK